MSAAIEIKNVSHNFKDKVVCDNISMDFEENKIYGLLGKNGAGKSTLINIITNQLICKSGEVKIFGTNPREDVSILEDVCVVREKEFFDPHIKLRIYSNHILIFIRSMTMNFKINYVNYLK